MKAALLLELPSFYFLVTDKFLVEKESFAIFLLRELLNGVENLQLSKFAFYLLK